MSPGVSLGAIHIVSCEPAGQTPLVAGHAITSDTALKELVINGKHRLLMNENTSLSIRPLVSDARLGCLVELDRGEILAEVEHDGNPFVVATAHGKASITGTVFDIRATRDDTALVVVEGSVRLQANGASVDVGQGQTSYVSAGRTPSAPVCCDSISQTAWARRVLPVDARSLLADGAVNALPLPELFAGDSFDPRELDYDTWVQRQQNWFEQQFPEVFRLKKALTDEGIDVAYPDLLVQSGVLWQFGYPPARRHRLLPTSDEAIVRAASRYGMDRGWLEEKRLIGGCSCACVGQLRGTEAFTLWSRVVSDALADGGKIDERVLLASFHTAVYVVNTRTLIWLALETGRYAVSPRTPKEHLQMQLRDDIEAACTCAQKAAKLLGAEDSRLPCDGYAYRQLVEGLSKAVAEMADIEKELADEVETVEN